MEHDPTHSALDEQLERIRLTTWLAFWETNFPSQAVMKEFKGITLYAKKLQDRLDAIEKAKAKASDPFRRARSGWWMHLPFGSKRD